MTAPRKNLRDLLTAIGIGDFNATMIIPYMMIAPSTTDTKAAQVILMVQQIQKSLYALGATDVALTGQLDRPTGVALDHVAGINWERQPWSHTIKALVHAQERGAHIPPTAMVAPEPVTVPNDGAPVAVGGPLDFLPDVPGGLLTYGIAGYLLYRHLSKRSAR